MKENSKEYIVSLLQKYSPTAFCLAVIFFEYALYAVGMAGIRPMLVMACVFFWLFNRPDIFNLGSVLILGFVCDFLSYTPPGMYLFSFLLLYVLEMKITKYISNKLFIVSLLSFGVLLFAIICAQWVLLSLYYKSVMPFASLMLSWLVTVCLYPLIADINLRIAKNLSQEEDFLNG